MLRVLVFSTLAIPGHDAHPALHPKISLHEALQRFQWTEAGTAAAPHQAQHAQGATTTAGDEAAGDGLEDAAVGGNP